MATNPITAFFLLLMTLFTLHGTASAQVAQTTDETKNTISLTWGVGIPVGDYRSQTPENIRSGYAKPGPTASISYQHWLIDNMGLSLRWLGGSHSIQDASLTKDFIQQIPSNQNWQLQTASWSYGGLGPGLILSFPIEQLAINLSSHLLYTSASFPESYLEDLTELGSWSQVLARQSSFNWGYDFSLELTYQIRTKLNIHTRTGMFVANHEFYYDITLDPPEKSTYTRHLKIRSLQIYLGLGYTF